MKTTKRTTRLALGTPLLGVLSLAAAGVIGTALAADPPAAPSATTNGVWQQHKYRFQYMGFTSTYSCDGLADQLKKLLIAAGARADAKSQAGVCASTFGRPDKFANADLTFYTLTPAVDGAAAAAIPGAWRDVTLTDHSPPGLKVGDCELVEQFRHDVLPMFTTRAVENHTTCVPFQESGSVIDLRFETLAAAKPAPGAATVGAATPGAPGVTPPTAGVAPVR